METEEVDLKRELEKFKSFFNAVPDAMIVIDEAGKIVASNSETEKIFGYSFEEIIGKEVEVLMPGAFRAHHKHHRANFMERPRPRGMGIGLELFAQRKSGEIFPVEVSLSPTRTNEGVYILSAVRDITERKAMQKEIQDLNTELEARIKQRTKELEESNKELEAFSYSVSHDLRTPLRAINGYAEMLEEDFQDSIGPEGKRVIELIKGNAIKMGHLIDNLLSFSRLGKKDVLKTLVNMNEVCHEVVSELHDSFPHKAEIRINDLHFTIADQPMMKIVLYNLIANAVKYSSPKERPRVQIDSVEEETRIIYHVQDNGVGFDMKFASKLYNVFERLHSAKQFEGNGVGLAIVKRIIQKHGGDVWAVSEENYGSTFSFSLPKEPTNKLQL